MGDAVSAGPPGPSAAPEPGGGARGTRADAQSLAAENTQARATEDEAGPPSSVSPGPTTRERALRAAAGELTPARALQAIDEASGRITGAVTLAGTIAAGLGLVSAAEL